MKTKKLSIIGILQEQHPIRADLFQQWKRLDFPLLADPLNVLDVSVVPIHLLVDGDGIIRYRNPSDEDLKVFMKADYSGGKEALQAKGNQYAKIDKLAMVGQWEEAMKGYNAMQDEGGRLHFRKGVVWRMRFDDIGDPGAFKKAVSEWRKAREVNGAQYIWRRRIQQYGPQSDKPYPFYNWVAEAQKDIRTRGEIPVSLSVELTASELASPRGKLGNFPLSKEPDAKSELPVDEDEFEILPIVIPSTDGKKKNYRVHMIMRPQGSYYWNNEGGEMKVWLGKGEGHIKGFSIPVNSESATSSEVRDGEFEWLVEGSETINGYVVFHVCSKKDGVCTILRKNFQVRLPE